MAEVEKEDIKRYVLWRDQNKCVSCGQTQTELENNPELPIYQLVDDITIPSTMITICSTCEDIWRNPDQSLGAKKIRRNIDKYILSNERASSVGGFIRNYQKLSEDRLQLEIEAELQEVKFWLLSGRSLHSWLSEEDLSDGFETELGLCIEYCPFKSIQQNYEKWTTLLGENKIDQQFVELADAIRKECKLYTEKECEIQDKYI